MADVDRWLRAELSPLAVTPIAAWHPGSYTQTVCGEIEAPPALKPVRATLRYIHYADGSGGFLERHELVVGTSASAQNVIVEARRIFDDGWASNCAPNAPLTRRIAAWFGTDSAGDGRTDTPMTNAYAESVLGSGR